MNSSSTSQNQDDAVPEAYNETENKLIIHLIRRVLKKWWLFAIVGLLAAIGGFIYASKQKTVYSSELTFALDEGGSDGGMSGALSIASQFGISLGGAKDVFTGDNILEIMMSRRIIERVLLSVDTFENKPYILAEYYFQKLEDRDEKDKLPDVHYLPGEQRSQFSYAKDSILYDMYLKFANDYISTRRPNKKLNIFEVSVTSRNEKFTKVFTDKFIAATNDFYVEITSKKSKETLDILERRIPVMKNKLNESINNRASAEDANINKAFASGQVTGIKEQANAEVYGTAYGEILRTSSWRVFNT